MMPHRTALRNTLLAIVTRLATVAVASPESAIVLRHSSASEVVTDSTGFSTPKYSRRLPVVWRYAACVDAFTTAAAWNRSSSAPSVTASARSRGSTSPTRTILA
ncbi:MAG: hypothetical protein Q9O74_12265 [Planctomycetota bacterium]|nr:hypothetical protein [Planctomycetota bacterium]